MGGRRTPVPAISSLSESRTADVAIIGGGYTGLSTALHLAEKGVDVCLLEASEPGWGASGRNGGMVIPGLKYDPDELVRKLGADRAESLITAVGNAADLVFGLIDKHKIECNAVRKGWIQLAHSAAGLKALARRASQWAARGARVEMLDHDASAPMPMWAAGSTIAPAAYSRSATAAGWRAPRLQPGQRYTATLRLSAWHGKGTVGNW